MEGIHAEKTSKVVQKRPSVLPHQRKIFDELFHAASIFGAEEWHRFSVRPRWHILLVAPTGTGKTHLVNSLAQRLGWPIYYIHATRWIIAGGRGKETWQHLADWLAAREGKCLICIDETDKIHGGDHGGGHGGDTWSVHLRTEIFSLLDRQIPPGIEINSPSDYTPAMLRTLAAKALNFDCLIVAAGAFQSLWDHRPKELGFGSGTPTRSIPSPQEMKNILPAELINRFGQILAMPPLQEADYRAMIAQVSLTLPEKIRERFQRIAQENLQTALEEGKGARYAEECVTAALLDNHELNLDPNREKEESYPLLCPPVSP